MKIKQLILLSSIAFASVAYAADGTITITGKVLENTCTLGGTSGDYTVPLPTVIKTALDVSGRTAGDTPFDLI